MVNIQFSDLRGEIEHFPRHIVQEMCIHQLRQGNRYDVTVFQKNRYAAKEYGGFDWDDTPQGKDFWGKIIDEQQFEDFKETSLTAHFHADSMLLYARHACTTETPWLLWEYSTDNGNTWSDCDNSPSWSLNLLYRVKSNKIKVGSFTVHRPCVFPLNNGQHYFVASLDSSSLHYEYVWHNTENDFMLLERGLVHVTKEAAMNHANAILSQF